MEFEWDAEKDAANRVKHGISFGEAQVLWNDSGLVLLPSRFPDESRYLAIGRIEEIYWTAIFTERVDRIRIISVRRARDDERTLYEQTQDQP